MKRAPIATFVLVAIWFSTVDCSDGQAPVATLQPKPVDVKAIHTRALTIDTHVDISNPYATADVDPGSEESTLLCTLPKMEQGGLKGVFLAVYVQQRPELNPQGYQRAYEAAMVKFEAIHRLTEKLYPDRCALTTSVSDVRRIAPTGKRMIMIGIENGYPVGEDLSLIDKFYSLGARYITLSHNRNNQICDSSSDAKPLHNGLSAFGKKVVAEMNRVGMMVDISHISEKSFWDVLAATRAPVIASHSGCAALTPHDRNLADEQLRALGKNGGVVQAVALGTYLDSPERLKALKDLNARLRFVRMDRTKLQKLGEKKRSEYEAKQGEYRQEVRRLDEQYPPASLTEFVNHIDHAVKIVGIDHVGIGTDFDGGGGIPGFKDESEAMNVTAELVRRGYSEADIDKIWGGNLLRVWSEVERIASQAQTARR